MHVDLHSASAFSIKLISQKQMQFWSDVKWQVKSLNAAFVRTINVA